MTRLHVFYRSTGGDKYPHRPPYFDKMVCLRSFLRSYRQVRADASLVFLNDGPMPEDRVALMERWGTVVQLPGLGNSPSFWEAIRRASALPQDAIVYFAEDDYLYLEPGLARMLAVFAERPEADYVTLYDHLDRYTRGDDARGGQSHVVLAGGQHWRGVESTCMTFAARVARLRADRWAVWLTTRKTIRPRDRRMWRLVQGLWPFPWKLPKRRLYGAIPGLATHLDRRSLSPFTDWAAVAGEAAGGPLD